MDIIIFCLAVWFLGGWFGLRKRHPRHKRKKQWWKPSMDVYDYEEHLRRNGK